MIKKIKAFKSEYKTILFILLIAFAVRAVYWHFCPLIAVDGAAFVKLGKLYFAGNVRQEMPQFFIYSHPLYPALLGLLNLLVGNCELVGKLISFVCGLLLVLVVYLFTRNIYGKKEGFYAAIIASFFPQFAYYSQAVLTESLYFFLSISGIYLGWLALKTYRSKFFVFAGISFGLAYLTKPEGFVAFLVFLFLMLFSKYFMNNLTFRDVISRYVLVILVFGCFAVPYIIFLHHETGRWTLSGKTTKGASFGQLAEYRFDEKKVKERRFRLRSLNEDNTSRGVLGEIEKREIKATGNSLLGYLIKNPQKLIKKYVNNLALEYRKFIPQVVQVIPLIIIGLGFFANRFNISHFYLSFYIIVFWGIFYPLIYAPLPRYLTTIVPLILIWGGRGVVAAQEWLNSSLDRYLLKIRNNYYKKLLKEYAVIMLLVLCLMPSIILELNSQYHNKYVPQKEVGLWMKNNLSTSSSKVMCWMVFPAYYSGMKWEILPYAEVPRIIKYAKFKGVKYIVFDEESKNKYTELLFDNDGRVPSGIELIYRNDDLYKILVFKVS